MQGFSNYEADIIKLVMQFSNLTVRRIHVTIPSLDSFILAKTTIDKLVAKGVLSVNDQQIVVFTDRFASLIKQVHISQGKPFPKTSELNTTTYTSVTNTDWSRPDFDESDDEDEVSQLLTEPEPTEISSAPFTDLENEIISTQKDDSVSKMKGVRRNLSTIKSKMNEQHQRPVIKNRNKRVEDLFYLSNILDEPLADLVRETAFDLMQASA